MLYYILMPLAWVAWRVVFRIEVVGAEQLKREQGYILAPNHVSAIDPVFVIVSSWFFLNHKMRIFAKRELFEKNFLLSWFLHQVGCVSVKNGKEDVDTLARTEEECAKGKILLLFPEGTRSRTGELLPPKSGAFVVADAAKVDMVPCRILYNTPDGRMHPFCRARICFGPAIPAEELSMGEKRDMRRLRENKKRLVASWQQLGADYAF